MKPSAFSTRGQPDVNLYRPYLGSFISVRRVPAVTSARDEIRRAREQLKRGKLHLLLALGLNARTVAHDLRRRHSPARATVALISCSANYVRAFVPFLARVEVGRKTRLGGVETGPEAVVGGTTEVVKEPSESLEERARPAERRLGRFVGVQARKSGSG